MDSLKESLSLSEYHKIVAKVDALIEEKNDAIQKGNELTQEKEDPIQFCGIIFVNLFVPAGAIYMLFGALYSHFILYIVGVVLLFWGTISYSILSLRERLRKKKFILIDD
jgi:hypothetical protein